MKKLKWIFTSVMLIIAIAMMAGCSSNETKGQAESPEDAVKAALEKTDATKNYDAQITMNTKMSDGTNEQSMLSVNKMTVFTNPLLMMLDITTTANEENEISSIMYIQEKDGNFTTYLNYDSDKWMQQTLDKQYMPQILNQYDSKANFKAYLSSAGGFTEAGEEDVNGVKAKKYGGSVAKEQVLASLNDSGIINYLGLNGLTDTYLDGITDLPVSVWVETESGYISKMSVDLSPVLQKIFDNMEAEIPEGTEVTHFSFDEFKIEYVCSNFNNAEKIEIPEEALNAEDFDEVGTEPFPEGTVPTPEISEEKAPEKSEAPTDSKTQGE